MFETIAIAPVLPRQDAFSAETTLAVRAAYEKVFSLPTKLMSLRSLIAKLAQGYVTSFELRSDRHRTSQHYSLLMGNYTLWIRLGTFAPVYQPEREITAPCNVLTINALLKSLYADMSAGRDEADDYQVVHQLVTRIFVLCSADAAFECTTADGRWTLFFHDQAKRAQASVVVERRA